MANKTLQEISAKAQQPKPSLMDYLDREEQGDAELFESEFTGKVVYDHAARAWYLRRDNYWIRDTTNDVTCFVSNNIASIYLQQGAEERKCGNKEKSEVYLTRGKRLLTRKRIDNVIDLATSRPGLKISGNEWDTSKMILPCKNGIIDLTTGKLRTARPDEYIKSYTDIEWLGLDYSTPLWDKFLRSIFNRDSEMIEFVQRLFGYGVSGTSTERVLPFFWGSGSNGKSILIEVIREVLGESLCHKTSMDVFMDTRRNSGEGAKPALLKFRGMRLIYANESKERQRIDTGIVKEFTGNDAITARGLHQSPVTFLPTWLIVLVTNHKPIMPSDDQAVWDRVMLIEFSQRFVDKPKAKNEHARDKNIKEKLMQEAPGILAWLVKGCLEWQRNGLQPPQAVMAATDEYRKEEDIIGQYVSERLVASQTETQANIIYADYSKWAADNGLNPLASTNFYRKIKPHVGDGNRKNDGSYYPVKIKSTK